MENPAVKRILPKTGVLTLPSWLTSVKLDHRIFLKGAAGLVGVVRRWPAIQHCLAQAPGLANSAAPFKRLGANGGQW